MIRYVAGLINFLKCDYLSLLLGCWVLLSDFLVPDSLVFPIRTCSFSQNALHNSRLLRLSCIVARVLPQVWMMRMMLSQWAILLPVVVFLRLLFGSKSSRVRNNDLAD